VRHTLVGRAITDAQTVGFTQLVLDHKGHVLGATIVGPRAGETLAEVVLAVGRGLRTRDLAGTAHAYPTYSYGPWDASIDHVRAQLRRPAAARFLRLLTVARRHWVDARAHYR